MEEAVESLKTFIDIYNKREFANYPVDGPPVGSAITPNWCPKEMVMTHWRDLLAYVNFLELDESIEPKLANDMRDKLMAFKDYAYQCKLDVMVEDGWIAPKFYYT